MLETDDDLRYYRSIRARYGSDDFLIVTYTPDSALFDPATLGRLRALRDGLANIERVASVTSILDVPLLESPPLALQDLPDGIRYLDDPDMDLALARRELVTSPLYRNLVISPGARTAALRVDFEQDDAFRVSWDARERLRERQLATALAREEIRELARLDAELRDATRLRLAREQQDIAAIRTVMARHADGATLHLGGVPMIVADSIDFIRRDMLIFGIGVLIFLVVILQVDFKRLRWTVLPMVTCLGTSLVMVGLLGLTDWRVTVVSSNFLSLLLILTLALTLHLIVRYRELHALTPDAVQRMLVSETVRTKWAPCLYTALTTMVAFGSLLVSDIRPVIDFGWMMVIGLAVAFLLSFTLFPAGLMLLQPGRTRRRRDLTGRITEYLAGIVERRPTAMLTVYGIACAICILGMTRLTVENRFIDYYKESTEIFRGMELIDRQLGGTTPLEVIVDAPLRPAGPGRDAAQPDSPSTRTGDEDSDEFESFGEELDAEAGLTATSYWFNSRRLPQVERIHAYLDGLPETGKVMSLATVIRVLAELEPSVIEDDFKLAIVYKRLPDEVRQALFAPYLSDDGNQLRFAIRVFETDPTLRRQALLDEIRSHLTGPLGLDADQIHLTGMLVLYNNMLQSLFRSQILTLGAVFGAIALMFLVVFRSARIAAIAILPNAVAGVMVLGVMGWAKIPLDLMTITIAAITVGIAVDNTIHYVHRFTAEFPKDRRYWPTVHRCHGTIGRAMYYTSVTIMLGFSILALSTFVPTIYFGVLTGLAMVVALLADMTLLPVLLVVLRAGGPAAPDESDTAG